MSIWNRTPSNPTQQKVIQNFNKYAFLLVRQVFPSMTNNLVSVQPMSVPAGLLFYMDIENMIFKMPIPNHPGFWIYGGTQNKHRTIYNFPMFQIWNEKDMVGKIIFGDDTLDPLSIRISLFLTIGRVEWCIGVKKNEMLVEKSNFNYIEQSKPSLTNFNFVELFFILHKRFVSEN